MTEALYFTVVAAAMAVFVPVLLVSTDKGGDPLAAVFLAGWLALAWPVSLPVFAAIVLVRRVRRREASR